jgi:hypothetical protein
MAKKQKVVVSESSETPVADKQLSEGGESGEFEMDEEYGEEE